MAELFTLNTVEYQALLLSLKVAFYCVLILLPLSLFVGYKMARVDFYGKAIVESVINLPLVLPPVTTGYLLLVAFGANSFLGKLFMNFFGIRIAFGFLATVLAAIVVSFPLIVRSVRTSFELNGSRLEDVSRTLGKGKWETFFKVTLPLAMPGVIAGVILAFARSLGEFGATITFAGNIEGETQTLPLAIYTVMQQPGKETSTIRLVIISIILSFVAMILSELYIKKIKHDRG